MACQWTFLATSQFQFFAAQNVTRNDIHNDTILQPLVIITNCQVDTLNPPPPPHTHTLILYASKQVCTNYLKGTSQNHKLTFHAPSSKN